MFRQEPGGRHRIKICRTLSCALGGSHELRDYICKKLGLDANGHGPQTTKDGKFTVEFVECLAGCGAAPVVMVNEEYHEGVTKEKLDEICATCQ
jgi:NADH-quinone oxidoreductase subunit E